MNRTTVIATVAGAAAIGLAAFATFSENDSAPLADALDISASAQESAPVTEADIEAFKADGYAVGDIVLGDPNAPVTITEYANMTCPACARFHSDVLPTLKERYIDTGKAKLVVREIFAGPGGVIASAIARCGGEERYHPFLDVLFKRQAEWGRADSVQELVAKIAPIGRLGGLSTDRMNECLQNQTFVDYMVTSSQAQADAAGIRVTPTLFIDGDMFDGRYDDIDGIGAMIEAALP